MSDSISFLITILYGQELMRVALKVKQKQLKDDFHSEYMEPENLKQLHALLPLHVQTCGPIVEVQHLFEVHDATPDVAQELNKETF